MTCPVTSCPNPVAGPLRICARCWRFVPIPQAKALNSYARTHKGGPAHQGAFLRAVKTIEATIEARKVPQPVRPERVVSTPYRDD